MYGFNLWYLYIFGPLEYSGGQSLSFWRRMEKLYSSIAFDILLQNLEISSNCCATGLLFWFGAAFEFFEEDGDVSLSKSIGHPPPKCWEQQEFFSDGAGIMVRGRRLVFFGEDGDVLLSESIGHPLPKYWDQQQFVSGRARVMVRGRRLGFWRRMEIYYSPNRSDILLQNVGISSNFLLTGPVLSFGAAFEFWEESGEILLLNFIHPPPPKHRKPMAVLCDGRDMLGAAPIPFENDWWFVHHWSKIFYRLIHSWT